MIVTFNPMINTGADVNAAYINFLRCVTAAATAASGTTTLTVNPFTNNTGTIDGTKNCIVSIDANTEAGGWATSASHNVPNTGSFTAIASAAAFLYKADFYNASGKSTLPYNKLSFHASGMSSSIGNPWTASSLTTYLSVFATQPYIYMTFGSSSSTDWTSTTYPPVGGTTLWNTGTQTTSWTLNSFQQTGANATYGNIGAFFVNNTNVYYRIAVTANYCIVWEVPNSNSYANGYAGVVGTNGQNTTYNRPDYSYGMLMYGGLRETQPWENALTFNPPWVAFQVQHTSIRAVAPGYANGTGQSQIAAYMATLSDVGVASSTATQYASSDRAVSLSLLFDNNLTTVTTATGVTQPGTGNTNSTGLNTPLYYMRDVTMAATSHALNTQLPVSDPNTGSLVPPAIPIVARRGISGTWNNGGALRGIYKSLSMPITTMKNYFSNGQTFTVGSDTYIPIVFNETMYLIRNA